MRIYKQLAIGVLCLFLVTQASASPTAAAPLPIFGIVRAAIKKAIKAIDLRIQRLQNKTIWLQNAQQQVENTLSKLKLNEISDWSKKQRDLYKEYYEELMKVKSAISYYQRIRDVADKQARLVQEYQRAWSLFQQDEHFNIGELEYMQKVYGGILGESLSNIDQIFLILKSFSTQMDDAERLAIINGAADRIDSNYNDLKRFNRENIVLSMQRAKTKNDLERIRKFYGLTP